MSDAFNLRRFVDAQEGVYGQVVQELRTGRKTGHWIWFIFPQIAGLGFSGMSKRYAISSLDEARAYLEHPELGPRLIECVELMLLVDGKSADEILGGIDAIKFRSCLTLFAAADPHNTVFRNALTKFFADAADELTLTRITPND